MRTRGHLIPGVRSPLCRVASGYKGSWALAPTHFPEGTDVPSVTHIPQGPTSQPPPFSSLSSRRPRSEPRPEP